MDEAQEPREEPQPDLPPPSDALPATSPAAAQDALVRLAAVRAGCSRRPCADVPPAGWYCPDTGDVGPCAAQCALDWASTADLLLDAAEVLVLVDVADPGLLCSAAVERLVATQEPNEEAFGVLRALLLAGHTTTGHAFVVRQALGGQTDALAGAVLACPRVLGSLRADTPGDTARLLARVIAELDPDALADSEQQADRDRDAWVSERTPGRACLIAPTTGSDAAALRAVFEQAVRAAQLTGDERGRAQLRHDLLLDPVWQRLGLAGRPDTLPFTPAGSKADEATPAAHDTADDVTAIDAAVAPPRADGSVLLGLTLSLNSLLGGDTPGGLDHGGVVSAELGRRLAALATRLRVLVHDEEGRLVYATPDYRFTRPAARTARHAAAGRCSFPGCRRDEVDLDHAVPYAAGGPTSLANAVPACRRHPHSHDTASRRRGSSDLKTHHRWRTGIDTSSGEITWTRPGVRRGTSRPPDWTSVDPLPPEQRSRWPVLPAATDGRCPGHPPLGPPGLGPNDWDDPLL